MAYYTATGIPAAQTRGVSSNQRAEFVLIQTGFATAEAAINAASAASIAGLALKGAISGQVWTGNHDFTGANYVRVPTPVIASDAVTKSYADNLVYMATLPGQALGFLKSTGSVASFGATHTGYAQNEVKGADIASASTINLTTATGNFAHITGTTTINAITIPVGALRSVVFDGALALTHSASLLLPGAANITTAANDRMTVRGDTAGAIVTSYARADGTPVKGGMTLLATLTPTASATVDFTSTFTSSFDNYQVNVQGVLPSSTDALQMRLFNAGVIDTASNYIGSLGVSGASVSTALGYLPIGINTLNSGQGLSANMMLMNANDAVGAKTISGFAVSQSATGPATFQAIATTGAYTKTASVSGIRFYWNTGANFAATGKIRVYGYNNS